MAPPVQVVSPGGRYTVQKPRFHPLKSMVSGFTRGETNTRFHRTQWIDEQTSPKNPKKKPDRTRVRLETRVGRDLDGRQAKRIRTRLQPGVPNVRIVEGSGDLTHFGWTEDPDCDWKIEFAGCRPTVPCAPLETPLASSRARHRCVADDVGRCGHGEGSGGFKKNWEVGRISDDVDFLKLERNALAWGRCC